MSELVTRREAEEILGFARGSLGTLMVADPDRWPAPAVTGRPGHPHLYRLDELRAAANRGGGRVGRRASLDDTDDSIECLYCGRRFRSLGPHLARIHGTTAQEYRAEHRLPATAALMARSTREALHEAGRTRAEADPRVRAVLVQDADEQRHRMALSAEGRAATDGLPLVRARRREALERHARPARLTRYAAARDEKARTAGYLDWADAIAGTAALPQAAAARVLGVGKSTIQRWRRGTDG